jgi:HD superfamily phosphodiesterase
MLKPVSKDHLKESFRIVENSFKEVIESFFLSIYPANYLISHGIEHHRRVWEYAKDLLRYSTDTVITDPLFIKKLMFACYFHDIGMAIDFGVNHGNSSMNKCIEFMIKNGMDPAIYKDALEAIHFHDDKNYDSTASHSSLLKILSSADDLDAFGFIGIFRYADIFLRRNVNPVELGIRIKKNAAVRFKNFLQNHPISKDSIKQHNDRFMILDNFFLKYNEQAVDYAFGTNSPSGYCGVIEIFISYIKQDKELNFSNILNIKSKDPVIVWYFEGIISELNHSKSRKK